MTTITTRAAKGSPLTNAELDANFTNLNTYKVEQDASGNVTVGGVLSVLGMASAASLWATSAFSGTFTDGVVLDYVSGTGRITVGSSDGLSIYNGGPSSRNALFGVDSSGNVNVGITGLTNRLAIAGTTNGSSGSGNAAVRIGTTLTSGGSELRVFTDSTNSQVILSAFTTGVAQQTLSFNSGALLIDPSSNVGLGVTPSAWSGGKAIDMGSTAGLFGYPLQTILATNAYWSGSSWVYKTANTASYLNLNGGQFQFYTAPSGAAGSTIGFTQMATLNSTGLGLGNTGPATIFDAQVSGGRFQLYSAVTTTGVRLLSVNTGNAYAVPMEISGSEIRFTNSSNVLSGIFTGAGYLGIGTPNPQSLLHLDVDGTAFRISRGSAIGFLYNTGTSASDIFRLQSNGGSVQLYTNGGAATLDTSGAFGLGLTNPSSYGKFAIQDGSIGLVTSSYTTGEAIYKKITSYAANGQYSSLLYPDASINFGKVDGFDTGWTHGGFISFSVTNNNRDQSPFEVLRVQHPGIGVRGKPALWSGLASVVDMGDSTLTDWSFVSGFYGIGLTTNCYYDGANWRAKYTNTTKPTKFTLPYGGGFLWSIAGSSATAGSTLSFTDVMAVDGAGQFGVGLTPYPFTGAGYGNGSYGLLQAQCPSATYPTGDSNVPAGYAYAMLASSTQSAGANRWLLLRGSYNNSAGTAGIFLQDTFYDNGQYAGRYIQANGQALIFGKSLNGTQYSTNASLIEHGRFDWAGNFHINATSKQGKFTVTTPSVGVDNGGGTGNAISIYSSDNWSADLGATIGLGGMGGLGSTAGQPGGPVIFASISGRKSGASANHAGYLQIGVLGQNGTMYERGRVDSSGNWFLASDPLSWANGGTVQGGSFSISSVAGVDQTAWVTGAYQPTYTGSWYSRGAYRATIYQQIGGAHAWLTHGSTPTAAGQAITLAQSMFLDTSGCLYLGTTSRLSSGVFSVGFVPGTSQGIVFKQSVDVSSPTPAFFLNSSGTVIGSITTTASATAYNTSSDQRLKTNITPAGSAIQSILDFPVDQFDWISSGEHQDFGGVAQKVLPVIPEMVSVPADPDEMMGIDWSKAVPRLIRTAQEQHEMILALRDEFEQVKATLH